MSSERAALPPRVLYVASTRSHGGIERHSADMAAALAARGVPVRFACRRGSVLEGWCRARGVPALPFSPRNSGDLGAARRLARLIEAEEIDLVHAHSRRDYVVAALGTRMARRPARLILHAHMVRPLGEPPRAAGRFFAWGADAVAAVSGAVCDRLRHDHGFSPALVHLIPNGVPLGAFARPGSPEARRRRQAARRAWGIPEGALVVGMVGRLDAKGQAAGLDAVASLGRSDIWCVFIGSEGEPGARQALRARAARLGWSDRLILTGPREDVPALLPGFDVLMHLPADEAFGLALAEAMAAGLPTIATDIGGCREVIRAGRTGLLVPLGGRESLGSALGWLLDPQNGADRRAALGAEGRAVAEAELSQDKQLVRLQALYAEVLARPGESRAPRSSRALPRMGWAAGGLALAACALTASVLTAGTLTASLFARHAAAVSPAPVARRAAFHASRGAPGGARRVARSEHRAHEFWRTGQRGQ